MRLQMKVKKLSDLFQEGADLLSKYEVKLKNDEQWSKELARLSEKLEFIRTEIELKAFIMQNEQELFGVKDTFIELVISSGNGHIASDFHEANQKLNAYRYRLYESWKLVKEELEKNRTVP